MHVFLGQSSKTVEVNERFTQAEIVRCDEHRDILVGGVLIGENTVFTGGSKGISVPRKAWKREDVPTKNSAQGKDQSSHILFPLCLESEDYSGGWE